MTRGVREDRPRWVTLRRSSDIECAFRRGERLKSGAILVIYRPRSEGALRVAFLTAKGLGAATRRNRQRRRLREAFRRLWPRVARRSVDVLLMALPAAECTGFGSLVDTMSCLLARVELLSHDATPIQ